MTKQSIRRSLQKASEVQAFMTAKQFAQAMGMKSADYAKEKFLSGLECIDGKYYLIADIAEELMQRRDIKEE